jgi:hypothetical protein
VKRIAQFRRSRRGVGTGKLYKRAPAERLCEAADNHTPAFDVAFIDGLHQIDQQFKQARSEQLAAKVDLQAATLAKKQARLRIELQVTRNVMTLAIEFLEEPKKGLAFFDTSLLKLHQKKKKKDVITPVQ